MHTSLSVCMCVYNYTYYIYIYIYIYIHIYIHTYNSHFLKSSCNFWSLHYEIINSMGFKKLAFFILRIVRSYTVVRNKREILGILVLFTWVPLVVTFHENVLQCHAGADTDSIPANFPHVVTQHNDPGCPVHPICSALVVSSSPWCEYATAF